MSIDEGCGGSVAETTSIDVPEVLRMSEAVLDAAGRLDRLAARIENRGDRDRYALPGSVTCDPSLVTVAVSWRHRLDDLAEEIRGLGTHLHTTATDYRAADEFAAHQVRASGHPAFGAGGGAGPR